jgi:hypothetical protein
MEDQPSINALAAIATTVGGIVITIVGMLIKGRLDFERLKQNTRNDCRVEIDHEREIHNNQVRKLERELEAISGAFALVQSRTSTLPCCYMTLEGVFVSFSDSFTEVALEPLGIKPDDLIGTDGIGLLPADVAGPLRLMQSKAIVAGAAVLDSFRFIEGGQAFSLFMEAMADHQTIVCKLVEK